MTTSNEYVTVDMDASKARKVAQKAYKDAYAAMKAADAHRREIVTAELIKAGAIPAGYEPAFSIRKWDGVLQVVAEPNGELIAQTPKAAKVAKATRTV